MATTPRSIPITLINAYFSITSTNREGTTPPGFFCISPNPGNEAVQQCCGTYVIALDKSTWVDYNEEKTIGGGIKMRKMGVLVLLLLATWVLGACGCQHNWQAATCMEGRVCTLCGASDGEPQGHKLSKATCTEAPVCMVCNQTVGQPNPHRWNSATCDKSRTCALCGTVAGNPLGHSWEEASCESAKTCTNCGKSEGRELGHVWQEADCKNPQTCLRCEETVGSELGHSYGAWQQGPGENQRYRECARCGTRQVGTVTPANP